MDQKDTFPMPPPINIGGLSVWNEKIQGTKIPGVTRVPLTEIITYFKGNTQKLRGLDLGSGQGRSTQLLKDSSPGSNIIALDLSYKGLVLTKTEKKVQAKAENLPFAPESFDFVSICGVMTNIVDENPTKAIELRRQVLKNVFSVIKSGGCVVISDFGSEHLLDKYPVNYKRHALITGENGTIAILKNGENFIGKSDEQIAAMKGTENIERYAHHFTPKELITLLQNAGFIVDQYTVELAKTPNGKKPIENIIILAKK